MRQQTEETKVLAITGEHRSPDALENFRIRTELMSQLRRLIEERGLTQTQAAKILRGSQPRVSDLVRGKSERFSIDALVTMLGLAGEEVSIVVRSRQRVA